jgi:hypothetical protein
MKNVLYLVGGVLLFMLLAQVNNWFSYEIKSPTFIKAMDVSNTETRKIVLYLKTQNGFTNFPYRFSNSISGDEMTIRAYARPPVLLNIDTMITKRWLEASEIILIPDHITRVRYGDCGPILWTKNASDNPTKILNSADFSYLEIKTLNPGLPPN